LLLPFKVNEIEFDSIEGYQTLLQDRNLHTLSLDFYTGVLFALKQAKERGLSVELSTFDTENSLQS
jgi:hypothetical protein